MTTYRIRTTSLFIWFLTLMITCIGLALLISFLIPKDDIILISCSVIAILLFANYLQRFTSRGELEISFTDTNISIKWLKQFLLHKNPDMDVLIGNIKSYKYQADRHFDLFALSFKDETELKIWHSSSYSKDDFEKFVSSFPEILKNKRTHKKDNGHNIREELVTSIKREETIYETQIGLVLAVLGVIFIVVIVYFLVAGKVKSTWDIFPLLAVSFSSAYFLGQVVRYRRQKKPSKKRLDN